MEVKIEKMVVTLLNQMENPPIGMSIGEQEVLARTVESLVRALATLRA